MVVVIDEEGLSREIRKDIAGTKGRLGLIAGVDNDEDLRTAMDPEDYKGFLLYTISVGLRDINRGRKDASLIDVEDAIYKYIIYKVDKPALVKFGEPHQDAYLSEVKKRLDRLNPKLDTKVNYPFIKISNVRDYRELEHQLVLGKEKTRVGNKQYFCVDLGSVYPHRSKEEVKNFLDTMVEAANTIQDSGIKFGMKSYSVLWHQLQRRENLLVYHRDQDDGNRVRGIVKPIIKSHALRLDNNADMSTAGFDFPDLTRSYNNLLANLVSNELNEAYKGQGDNPIDVSEEEISSRLARLRRLDPKELLLEKISMHKKKKY